MPLSKWFESFLINADKIINLEDRLPVCLRKRHDKLTKK